MDEDSVRNTFTEAGEIATVRFASDRETGEFRGFGHVEFVDPDAVDAAMAMAGTEVSSESYVLFLVAMQEPHLSVLVDDLLMSPCRQLTICHRLF